MRPIDADALRIVARGKNHRRKYVFADITDAPTIPAIPVEWIFEQMQILHELHNKNEYVLQWLMELWQKEQEAR